MEKIKKEIRKDIVGRQIEELLREERKKNNLTYIEVVDKLNIEGLKEKNIKKWEYGLEYPDLDTIYKLSELYQIPSAEIIQAKNNSYNQGMAAINKRTINFICYIFNVSIKVAIVIEIFLLAILLVLSLMFFVSSCKGVKRNM